MPTITMEVIESGLKEIGPCCVHHSSLVLVEKSQSREGLKLV